MRALVVLGISFSLGVASLGAAENSREIRWRSGPSKLTAGTAELDRQDRAGKRHVVMQFDAPLSREEKKHVERLGVRLQRYVGADAYFATLPAEGLDGAALRAIPTLTSVEAIRSSALMDHS